MPAVISKFFSDAVDTYERRGRNVEVISKTIVSTALLAYVVKISYPHIRKRLKKPKATSNGTCVNNNNNITKSKLGKVQSNRDEKLKIIEKKLKQPGLNLDFVLQLKQLVKIMIPKMVCRETGLLSVHTLCLISRTFLSIYVASMEGAIVKYIVRKDLKNFMWMLAKWFGIAIPATFINSMIRYLENKLALAFRTRLVDHAYKQYFTNQTYYKCSNLDGRIENADHLLTEDIATFSNCVAHLYSSITKPCFDLMLIGLSLGLSSYKMKANVVTGPLFGFFVISTTAHIMRIVSPKFGILVSEEANRNGYLRHIHSRIITNAEEIAFYGGHKVEHSQLSDAYNRLCSQMNTIYSQKLWFVMLEQFFMKYVWSGTGMIMVSLPILTTGDSSKDGDVNSASKVSDRTQYITVSRNLLISGADAVERLMTSYKEIVALAGYTSRVAGMFQVFDDVSKGIYRKTLVADESSTQGILEFKDGQPIAKGKVIYFDSDENFSITLKDVPVVTPNCDIVIPKLSLKIDPGMHVLITGPNGCGKSSLFRILSGLWPIYGGELHLPKKCETKPIMFYIPQRPYMSIGSLREQIIYPDSIEDMEEKNYSEEKLREILRMVSLEHIANRDSFDEVRDWKDTLSGGEKQRMAVARLFYHKPQYALLDECTSAVSIDVESSIYETAKNMGITLLTITHRPTLYKFHTHILKFDGLGNWVFTDLAADVEHSA